MKQSPTLCSILLFIIALCCFLLSELYFFLNPMFDKFDFVGLYLFPLILYLLSLGATIVLFHISHTVAKSLLAVFCFIVCALMLCINMWIFAEDHTVQAIYYPYNLSLWLSLSLLLFSVFTTALVIRSNLKTRPSFCCVLLFTLALFFFLLSGFSFLSPPVYGLNYPGWYLGQLLLYLLAIVAVIVLNRIKHTVARPFLIALACVTSAAAAGVCVKAFARNSAFSVNMYSCALSIWLVLPLPAFPAFVWGSIWRKHNRNQRYENDAS